MDMPIHMRCGENHSLGNRSRSQSIGISHGIKKIHGRRGNPNEIISDNAVQFKLLKAAIDIAWGKIVQERTEQSYITKREQDGNSLLNCNRGWVDFM